MADNIWDNSDADNDGNVAANWSLGNVPTGTDVAVFDSGTTSANCTFSGNISCEGMRFDNTYTGTVDAATFDITLGATGLVCTNAGSATLDLGSGTWTCSGDWDTEDVGTHTITAGGTLTLTGTTKTLAQSPGIASVLSNLTITGSYTSTVNDGRVGRILLIDGGTLTIATSVLLNIAQAHSGATGLNITNSGTLTGAGTLFVSQNANIATISAGTLDVATLDLAGSSSSAAPENATLAPGTYGSATVNLGQVIGSNADKRGHRFDAGVFIFTGDVTFGSGSAGSASTWDLSTNNPDLEFRGDLTFVEASGSAITWTKGTGDITFSGTGAQTVDLEGAISGAIAVEEIFINKTAGKVTLAGDLATDFVTATDGELDIDGNNLTSAGVVTGAANFTFSDTTGGGLVTCDTLDLNGTSGNVVTWNGPDLNVTGASAICDFTTATNSDASAGLEIDATNSGVDGTGNTNWNFAAGVTTSPWYQYQQQLAGAI